MGIQHSGASTPYSLKAGERERMGLTEGDPKGKELRTCSTLSTRCCTRSCSMALRRGTEEEEEEEEEGVN